jgi:hypothetical protein
MLSNRRVPGHAAAEAASAWHITHAEDDVSEAFDTFETSEQPVHEGRENALAQMFERIVAPAAISVTCGAFSSAFGGKRAFEELKSIYLAQLPWNEQLLRMAVLLPRCEKWFPSASRARLQSVADAVQQAVRLWSFLSEVEEQLHSVDHASTSWLERAQGYVELLDRCADWIPHGVRPALAHIRNFTGHVVSVRNEPGHAHTRAQPSGHAEGHLDDDRSLGHGHLGAIRRCYRAYANAYFEISALLNASTTVDQRLHALHTYIEESNEPELREFLREKIFPAVDFLIGLTRVYKSAQGFYHEILVVYGSVASPVNKLHKLSTLVSDFAETDLGSFPGFAQDIVRLVSRLLDTALHLYESGSTTSSEDVLERVGTVVAQIRAIVPALRNLVPEGASDWLDSVLHTMELATRQLHALLHLSESATFGDYLEKVLDEQGVARWMPEFMQPVLQVARQLSELLPGSTSRGQSGFPTSGSLSEQLDWTLDTLQGDRLSADVIALLPKRIADTVGIGRAVFMDMKTYPEGASTIEQARWIFGRLSGPDVKKLLDAGGLPMSEWLQEYIGDQPGKWFETISQLMLARGTMSAGALFALLERRHWPTIARKAIEVVADYIPFGTEIKRVHRWVEQTQLGATWQQTARNFVQVLSRDFEGEGTSGWLCFFQRIVPGGGAPEAVRNAARVIERLSFYSERWDWEGILREFQGDSTYRVFYEAFLSVRLVWSISRLVAADPLERVERVRQLEADVRKLSLLGWPGMNTLARLLPLLPDLWALRGQISVDASQARNWFDWIDAVAKSLVGSNAPAILAFRERLERETGNWLAGAFQQALTAALGKVFGDTSARTDTESSLATIPLRMARRVSPAETPEESDDGFVFINGARHVRDDGRFFLVSWDKGEQAYCVVPGDRPEDCAERSPLVRSMRRWYVRPRTRLMPGGGPVFRWFNSDGGNTTPPNSNASAQRAHTDARADALNTLQGSALKSAGNEDPLTARSLEYVNDNGEVRLRDFVIMPGAARSEGWLPTATGVAGGLGLLALIAYLWYASHKKREAPLRERPRASDPSTTDEREYLHHRVATDLGAEHPSAVPSAAERTKGWRPTRVELAAVAALGGASVAMIGWSLYEKRRAGGSKALVGDDDLQAGRMEMAGAYEIVVDVPMELGDMNAGTFAMASPDALERRRRSVAISSVKGPIEYWPLPRNAKIDSRLTAAVAVRFDPADSHRPRQGDFAVKHTGGVYWDAAMEKTYIFIAGRYWRYIYYEDQFGYAIAGITVENSRETLEIKRKADQNWELFERGQKSADQAVPSSSGGISPAVQAAVQRWDEASSFSYPEQAAGIDGRVYTNWDGVYVFAGGCYWPGALLHTNLLYVSEGKGSGQRRLYLKRSGVGSVWELATVVEPQNLPSKVDATAELVSRASAQLQGMRWTPGLVPVEVREMYRKHGSEALRYLKLGKKFYACREYQVTQVSFFPGSYVMQVWELTGDGQAVVPAPVYAALDITGTWQSVLKNEKNLYWAEGRVECSRALEDRVKATLSPRKLLSPATLNAVSPGIFRDTSGNAYLELKGGVYPCRVAHLLPEALVGEVPAEVVMIGDLYAGFGSSQSWRPLRRRADGMLEMEKDEADSATSASIELKHMAKGFDSEHALRRDDIGLGRDGAIYGEQDQLYICLNGQYWPFSLLSPHRGVVFGDASGSMSCLVTNSNSEWTLVASSIPFMPLEELVRVGAFYGFKSSLQAVFGARGFSTWSQALETLDRAADHEFYTSYLNPASERFRAAMRLKFQLTFLKSITDSETTGQISRRPIRDETGTKNWDGEVIGRYWSMMVLKPSLINDPDFSDAWEMRGMSREALRDDYAKRLKEQADVTARLKSADDEVRVAEGAEIIAEFNHRLAIGGVATVATAAELKRKQLALSYWRSEKARLEEKKREQEQSVPALKDALDLYEENPFVQGVALGLEREAAALEANERTATTAKHWQLGLSYSDIMGELTWEFIRASEQANNGQLDVIDGARLYIQKKWRTLDEFVALVARLAKVSPERRSLVLRGDFRDTVNAQLLATDLVDSVADNVDDEERAAVEDVLASLLYHLAKSRKELSAIDVGAAESIIGDFARARKELNPIANIGKQPDGFMPLSHMKPSPVTSDDTAFYDQFVDYEKNGSLDYEAAWLTARVLMKAGLNEDELISIRQTYFVHDAVRARDEIFIKLENMRWLYLRYSVSSDLDDPKNYCKTHDFHEMASVCTFWNSVPTIGDGNAYYGVWKQWDIGIDVPEEHLEDAGTQTLGSARKLIPALTKLHRRHLEYTVDAMKTRLYGPAWWRPFANVVPLVDTIYEASVNAGFKADAVKITFDVISIVGAVVPGQIALASAVSKVGIMSAIMQGVAKGLSRGALLRYSIGKIAASVPVFAQRSVAIAARMLYELLSPVPAGRISPRFRVKPVNTGSNATASGADLVVAPARFIPSGATDAALSRIGADYRVSQNQMPTGDVIPVDFSGNVLANENPQVGPIRQAQELGLSVVMGRLPTGLWEVQGYLLTVKGHTYRVRFDLVYEQYRLTAPGSWDELGPLLFYTDDGWRQHQRRTLRGFPHGAKPILHAHPEVSLPRTLELRNTIRTCRSVGCGSFNSALRVLDNPAHRAAVDRVLDIFFGDHSVALKDELRSRILAGFLTLKNLRPSSDILYSKALPSAPRAVMSTPAGDDFAPPRTVRMSRLNSMQLRRATNVAGAKKYLMTVYSEGMEVLEALTGPNYVKATAGTLMHESFHVSNRLSLDMYPFSAMQSYNVENIVANAGGYLKTRDAAGRVRNLEIDDLLTMPEHEWKARLAIRYSVWEISPARVDYRVPKSKVSTVYADRAQATDILRFTMEVASPAMRNNPDSFRFAVLGLEKIRTNPAQLDNFFTAHDRLISEGRGDRGPLLWPL